MVKEFSMPNFSFLSVTKDYHERFKDFAQGYIRPKNESAQNDLKLKIPNAIQPSSFQKCQICPFWTKIEAVSIVIELRYFACARAGYF